MPVREIVEIDEERCNGCGECIPNCAEGALEIVNGKVRLVRDDLCDGLGACLGYCPQGALQIIRREAPDFDEKAVKMHIRASNQSNCASCDVIVDASHEHLSHSSDELIPIGQRQWPIALRLVSINAPFFENADLLIAADCVPFAYSQFQQDFLPGKVLVYGCPKFDDAQGYIDKLAEIFRRNSVKSVTIVEMEVPCCSGLQRIVEFALSHSGKNIPVAKFTITLKGDQKA